MEQSQIKKIISLGKKYTYSPAHTSSLDRIENDLYRVVNFDSKNKIAIETLAKFLFERKKYEESLIQFNKLLKLDKNKTSAYYGIYKCYIMLNDYVNSYNYLVKYIERENDDITRRGTEIIFSLYDFIINNRISKKINENEIFIMNTIKDEELLLKYKELIESYNLRDYEKCILLAQDCEKICRDKNIYIEFLTFKQLLIKANVIAKTNLFNKSDIIYKNLELAIKNNDFNQIIQLLSNIPKINIPNENLIYNSIYVLIKNNYLKEAKQILDTFVKDTKNKMIINTLYHAIDNQINFNELSETELENYQIAIEKGHNYYQDGNFEYAYYIYTFGEYTTGNNIFLYYIGKMLYKLKQYDEAEKYLSQYIKIGSDKLAKAYLYLAMIYTTKNKRSYKKALYYSENVKKLDKIFGSDYDMYYFYNKEDSETDTLKMILQNDSDMYDDIFKEIEEQLNEDSVCKIKSVEIK